MSREENEATLRRVVVGQAVEISKLRDQLAGCREGRNAAERGLARLQRECGMGAEGPAQAREGGEDASAGEHAHAQRERLHDAFGEGARRRTQAADGSGQDEIQRLRRIIGRAMEALQPVADIWRVQDAIRILSESHSTRVEGSGGLIEQIRRKLGASSREGILSAIGSLKERMDAEAAKRSKAEGELTRCHEAAEAKPGEDLELRIRTLIANATSWEAEAKQGAERQKDLESCMDEAARLMRPVATGPALRQALALLERQGQGQE